tara:strand:+ start:82 stop:462 length:381 start_codon:yes stop_codon:yes gene_type:complete
MNALQAVILGNVATSNAFELNLWDWLTSNEQSKKGIMGKTSGTPIAMQVTLSELLTKPFSGANGSTQFTNLDMVWSNIKQNATPLITQMITIPIGFRVAKKLLRKPVLTPMNKALKMAGLNDVKVG